MDQSIFKPYDIRGKYPDEINKESVRTITAGILENYKKGKIVLGHDARLSSPSLYEAALKEVKSKKTFSIIEAGLITTPMLSFLVNKFKADLGIMVTASHNPKDFNGLKIVKKNAVSIGGE